MTMTLNANDDEPEARPQRCACGSKTLLVNGRLMCLADWLDRRPRDDD
jgi:hypothetical protein